MKFKSEILVEMAFWEIKASASFHKLLILCTRVRAFFNKSNNMLSVTVVTNYEWIIAGNRYELK